MKIRFETLEIEHFRSFSAKQTLHLSPSPGLWFLRGVNELSAAMGANGSGKSSLFEAVSWVLYGQTSKKLKNTDVKPWEGKGTPRGLLTLQVDGEKREVERTAKTNGLKIDGKECGPEEAAKLVGMSFEVFTNALYFPQGLDLFFDRTPKEKLQLLMEVLPIDKWEERSGRAAAKVKELEATRSELVGELSGLQQAVEQNQQLLSRAKQSAKDWLREQEQRVAAARVAMETRRTQLEKDEDVLGKLELELDENWVRVREMRADFVSVRKTADSARRQYEDEERGITQAEREVRELQRELKDLSKAQTCPTCGQPIKGKDLKGHKQELEARIAELEEKISGGVSPNITKLWKGAAGALKNFEAQLSEAEEKTDALQRKINVIRPGVEQLRAALVALADASNASEAQVNPYTKQIADLRKHQKALEADVEAAKEDQAKVERSIERNRYWIKGFKEVALYLIEEFLQELEAATNTILGEIGLADWRVLYAVERETKSGTTQKGINVMILPPQLSGNAKSNPIRWECWSGGEEQRLRIVGALALGEVLLRHAGVEANLEILDEPAKYIGGSGVEELCSYLSDRARSQGKTVWLVDHIAREGAVFAGTTVVRKTKTGSILSVS